MYQRAVVREFGEASKVVQLEPYEFSPLAPNDVRIRMIASAINPSDLITISGAYRSRTPLPFFPGFEGVGRIEEVGDRVKGLRPGDRVMPIGSAGTWQDVRDCEAEWCLNVSGTLTDEQAATSYVNPMTAWVMLHETGQVKPGMRLAITAAGSAIGRMLVRMANIAGVTPVAFVRSEASASLLTGMSVIPVICKTPEAYLDAIEEQASKSPVDVVFDCVGGDEAIALSKVLRVNGQFIHYGLLSGQSISPSFWTARPDIRFTMFHLRSWIRNVPLPQVHRTYEHLSSLLSVRQIGTDIRSRYRLQNVRDALSDAQTFSSAGKVLITP